MRAAWQGPCSALRTFPRRSQCSGREEKAECDCPCRPAPGGRMAAPTLTGVPRPQAQLLLSSLSAEGTAARGSVHVPRAGGRVRSQGPTEVRYLPSPGRPGPVPNACCRGRRAARRASSQQPLGRTGTRKAYCPTAGHAPSAGNGPAPGARAQAERVHWRVRGGGRKGARSRGIAGTKTPNSRCQGLLCCLFLLASGLR